jgi:hypothetical protein
MRELEGTKLYGWAQVSLEVAEGGLLVSAGADRRGRRRHFHAPPMYSLGILHTKQTGGGRGNDVAARG